MKIQNKFSAFTISVFLLLSVTYAYGSESSASSGFFTKQEKQSHNAQADSLPEGVSEEWLKDLRDENGNRLEINGNANSGRIPEEQETDALQRLIFSGSNAGENFGVSVSSAGDVNGDGYDDIIVGAQNYSSSTGRAYIFFGGLSMNTTADVTLTGGAANNYFGRSVSSAGDVNGDGYSDVIVGAYGYTSSTGRAYIYFGGSVMNNTADVTMTGPAANTLFGVSVSGAGDVNGDGYSDVIVGASGYSSGTGRAYIFFGNVSMDNIADVVMTGETTNTLFGYSVSKAGDVNGDGYADVITGAYNYSSITGRAYVYYGGASMNNVADVVMTGEAANNDFGLSVSDAGDVNGDGFSDVIVGAFGYNSSTGRAYIYYGSASMNNTADVILTGEASGIQFGISVSSAGDVNGDGFSDIIVGATVYSVYAGRAYIFLGGTSMNNNPDAFITGEASGNQFGYSVSDAGDPNGDGYSEVIAGAFGYSSNIGRAYLYDYYLRGQIIPEITMSGEATNNYFGEVSSAGDVNGDGYSDVIVGAWGYSSNTGRAYIYYGGAIMDNVADVTMNGESSGILFGLSVSEAGDVNGDGYSDVIVGAYGYSSFTGRAYIYYGGASMNNIADVILTGTANSFFGISVSTAGDVNGDGYFDVIAGASNYNSAQGRAFIFYGGASMNNVADVTMTGASAGIKFGITVSIAGDVNGDGYTDVIVGATDYNAITGRAYLYLGGSSMNSNSDAIFTGESTNSEFGCSVSDAGDVNGDGYSDIIIGARGYSSSTGRTYLFFGGLLIDNIPDVIITGETSNSALGSSVSSAGDINADGYSDVIVGADIYFIHSGKAFLFFGGHSMDNIPDVAMSGELPNDFFGGSVSSAGDINADGIPDIVVGASSNSSGAGRAYMFTGSMISIKPVLKYVKDVPNDQGGKVNLKWARSGYDVQGNSLVTGYLVQRSFPPSGGNYSWQNITTIPASHESYYTYLDTTPSDSSSNNSSTFFYRITAVTNDINQSWRSNILSGRSIDNIAPLMVSPFTSSSSGSNVILSWGASSAPDLLNYVLFRSTSPAIDPYTAVPLTSVNTTSYVDASPLNGLYYYFVIAQDIHGNYSPVAVTTSPFFTINLTVFIQGFYNAAGNTQISDTLKTYLRYSTAPYNIADSSKAVVSASGNAQLKFNNASDGNFYLVIKHRNSIETWSSAGISVIGGSSVNFNFSNLITQAYGSNQKQIDASPVRFGIFSGDVNQDGTVDATDVSAIDNDATIFVSGYVVTDLTGDGFVDGTDFAIADNNAANFVSVMRP